MVENQFNKLFTDPNFRWSSKKCYPNKLCGNEQKIGAVVVVRRGERGKDFALNTTGLAYVIRAEADGRLKEGHVVLAVQNGDDQPQVVASARATAVAERLRDVPPQDGQFGQYWWINKDFMPAARFGESADEPF
jgi:hypothetical protein